MTPMTLREQAGAPLHTRFPEGFLWGAATSSYQVEGAVAEDGRTPSCWDAFVRSPGVVHRRDTGDIACDSYHRLSDDLDLIRRIGLGSYRFSVSWSRVLPDGTGRVNEAGADYYRRLVDGLGSLGVRPMLTVFHWDLPQVLQDRGGWANRDCASWFADFAGVVAERLGYGVEDYITLNEPAVVANRGYRDGSHAPGATDDALAMAATHHLLLGHGLAVRRLREVLGTSCRVGITLDPMPVVALDGDGALATEIAGARSDLFLEPVLHGVYPQVRRRGVVPEPPLVHHGDMELIASKLDFIGINYYDPVFVRRAGQTPGRGEEPLAGYPGVVSVKPDGFPRTGLGWVVDPDSFHALLMDIHARAPGLPMYITENGCACHDYIGPDGEVRDYERIAFVRSHLGAVKRAIDDGADIRGYYLWSLLDNFEWTDGYSQRFGLVYVDFPTGARTPKASADFYARVIAANGLAVEGNWT
jgi:beta-glucosidase